MRLPALLTLVFTACASPSAPADVVTLDRALPDVASADTRDGASDALADTPLTPDVVDAGPPIEPLADYGTRGPHPVGNARTSVVDRTGTRTLPVELWYPAVESARAASDTGSTMLAFEAGTSHETSLAGLLAAAPPSCVRAATRSAPGAMAAPGGALPVVVFSHCHGCTRFDVAEVAERLASHGIVVAAPDHVGNTLWDAQAGMIEPVGEAFLNVRVSDVSSVLDRLLDPTAPELPAALRGRLDGARAAVMGHSFGGATTGPAVVSDPRFRAAMTMAAPISVLAALDPSGISVPYLFLEAKEDNSIGLVGNQLLRSDYRRLGAPAWLVELDDAGHWSFSDLAGLTTDFAAGCGAGVRQTRAGEAFTYLDNAVARDVAADAAMGFFARYLLGDLGGATFLSRLVTPAHVSAR